MSMDEYWKRVDDNRARVRAELDFKNNAGDFVNPSVETNPYIDMAAAYDEERKLLIEEFNRNGSKH